MAHWREYSNQTQVKFISSNGGSGDRNLLMDQETISGSSIRYIKYSGGDLQEEPVHFGSSSGLITDLSDATAATINQLRQAFQLQKLYERDARGGTRYTEVIRAHFGVTSPDARLQRPEYLGGGSTPITVTPVPQTSSTDEAVTPQGNLAAIRRNKFHLCLIRNNRRRRTKGQINRRTLLRPRKTRCKIIVTFTTFQ